MEALRIRRLAALLLGALMTVAPVWASQNPTVDDANIATLRQLLDQPEDQIDLARAKLTLDRMVDPTVDVEGSMLQLDQWAATVRDRFPANASTKVKRDLLISTLYEPGPWNDHRPFDYDYSDPEGRDLRTTLLSNYLDTRRGQCVSMPAMFVVLAQKLGLHATMTTAPFHLMAKFGDEDLGAWMNFEATSGRIYYDTQYEESLRIPPEAIRNEIYLRPHTQKEALALLATAAMAQHYSRRGDPERVLLITELILEANPRDVVAMAIRGGAYFQMLEQRFNRKYQTVDQIPEAEREDFMELSYQNRTWIEKAEALGWKERTQADWENYMEHFARKKSEQQGGN